MLGTGIYTPGEAAVLLRERPRTVRRWAFGRLPVIKTDLPELEGQVALTFVELVELLYIRAFERAGLTWPAIRAAAEAAARLFGTDHPFALRQFYVDPRSVYAAIEEQDGSESLVQLAGHGQHVLAALVKPYLEQLDFDADDVASRWWPMGRMGGVVIDPHHAFGAPVVEGAGIRAKVLSDAYQAERTLHGDRALERVAWSYEVTPEHVHAALNFETWLRKAA